MYKTIDPGLDATPEQITSLLNQEWAQGWELIASYFHPYQEGQVAEHRSWLIFRLRSIG